VAEAGNSVRGKEDDVSFVHYLAMKRDKHGVFLEAVSKHLLVKCPFCS
jgi:hypothetical protein